MLSTVVLYEWRRGPRTRQDLAAQEELFRRDTVGVDALWDTWLTPDGKWYAYVFIRSLSKLYQVTGLR